MGDLFKKNWKKTTGVRPDASITSQDELARISYMTSYVSGQLNEFNVTIPSGASLAAKIASATLPPGWTVALANANGVDIQASGTANEIYFAHGERSYPQYVDIVELNATTGANAAGYYVIAPTGAWTAHVKSDQSATQFRMVDFGGLIDLTRTQYLHIKMRSL